MEKLKEVWAFIRLEDGSYAVHGLPQKYIESCYPEINWGTRETLILTEEEAKNLYFSLKDVFGE